MNPWLKFSQPDCLPDRCQCEFPQDALIRQPSAFWSSLAYIFAGLFIYREIKDKSYELKLWSGACVLMGLSSMFGHMSFIKLAMAFDFASIILIMSFFGLLNLFRLLKVNVLMGFSFYYTALFFSMYAMNKWGKIGSVLIIFFFVMVDIVRDEGWGFLKEQTLQLSLFILVLSFGLFVMDEMHVGCDPSSLFQWHSLWHVGTALSMYYYGKWRLN